MREVVITDVKYRMTMTAIWSLGRKGIDITAVEYDSTPAKERLGFYSKYVSKTKVIPHPKVDEVNFVSALLMIGKDIYSRTGEKPVLIIPASGTHEVVICHEEEFKNYFVFNLVDQTILNHANNTFLLSQVAQSVDVPMPKTTWLEEDETIYELAHRIEFPVVIKYREGEKLSLKPNARYAIVSSREVFINQYKLMHDIQVSPLVQEYIEGDGFGVSCVFNEAHEPVEIFCHRRIREYPVSGGPSTFCESIWDDRMVSYAVKLLRELKWQGFAMVEFKGKANGDIRLMEINPRFWGSMPLSFLSKCDMPFAYYKSVMGLTTPNEGKLRFAARYRKGTKMQYILQDTLAAIGYLKGENRHLGLSLRYVFDLLNPFVKDGLFRFNDPKPGLMYFRNAFVRRKN